MTTAASSVLHACVDTLNDVESVQWETPELVRYLNDGQREIATHRPDATSKTAVLALVAGAEQTLPSDGIKLIDLPSNASGNKRAIRFLSNRQVLDNWSPNWQSQSQVTEIQHYLYDARRPRSFLVYPPAAVGTQVNAVYSAYPADVVEPVEGSTWDDVTGNISVPDIYKNCLQDYILFRAYSKDNGFAANAQRAVAHYGQFANALGIEISATVAAGPKSAPGNPSVPSTQA